MLGRVFVIGRATTAQRNFICFFVSVSYEFVQYIEEIGGAVFRDFRVFQSIIHPVQHVFLISGA